MLSPTLHARAWGQSFPQPTGGLHCLNKSITLSGGSIPLERVYGLMESYEVKVLSGTGIWWNNKGPTTTITSY